MEINNLIYTIAALLFVWGTSSQIGYLDRSGYNYQRGRLDGIGSFGAKVLKDRNIIVNQLLALLFIPIGIAYFLGWLLAKNKSYDLGYVVGGSDKMSINRIGQKLIDGQTKTNEYRGIIE